MKHIVCNVSRVLKHFEQSLKRIKPVLYYFLRVFLLFGRNIQLLIFLSSTYNDDVAGEAWPSSLRMGICEQL